MKAKLLNTWPERPLHRGEDRVSLLCFESTVPINSATVGCLTPIYPREARGPGKAYKQTVIFNGLDLAMAEDRILVADGLIDYYTVEKRGDSAHIVIITEHPVGARFVENDPQEGPPYRTSFSFSRNHLHRLFAGKVIAIDPGHGGQDTGVRGPVDLLEKGIALEIALEARDLLLASGASVVLTREKDEFLDDDDRNRIITGAGASLCVQVHASGEPHPLERKYHTFAKAGCSRSLDLGRHLSWAFEQRMGTPMLGVEELPEISWCGVPTVRVEPLCLTYFADEANFRAPLFRKRMGQAIYNGLARYFACSDETPFHGSSGEETEIRRDQTLLPKASKEGAQVLRVRTHLITKEDSPLEFVRTYTEGIAEAGDTVGIAESVLAIMQGRAVDPHTVVPSFLARFIAKFAHPDASISAPRSMQMAIREVGTLRILAAAVAGSWGKITGKQGLFFKVAGHEVAEIDDSGGTMPPYDRSIILGPKMPNQVARQIWRRTGLRVLILDVNDRGSVDVLGSSLPLTQKQENAVKELLRSNPFGNDDQKTPLVIIKNLPA